MNGYTFTRLNKSGKGTIPFHTCSEIDNVIELMESLRKANSDLREAAEYWKDQCESVCDERDDLDSKLESANDEISSLTEELKRNNL